MPRSAIVRHPTVRWGRGGRSTLNEKDLIVELVKKLLATEDPAEIQAISAELRAAIHDRIQNLRDIAGTLKPGGVSKADKRPRVPERRRRERF